MSTTTWPELAIGLYEKLTERNAEITYEFENMEVSVPSGTYNASNIIAQLSTRMNEVERINSSPSSFPLIFGFLL